MIKMNNIANNHIIIIIIIRQDKSYEEKVVLLTQLALYVCSFHYGLEKVVEFVRISLDTIMEIQRGK
jgi:hypothetical protein